MNTLYVKINTEFNENFTGYSSLAIILSTTLGSIAILTTMMNGNNLVHMFLIFLVVSACSAYNASILTVQKPSFVLKLLILSLLVSLLIIIIEFA